MTVSTIRGSVTDPSGAAVVGAKTTAVNLETNIERFAQSHQAGEYVIPELQRGTCRLTAALAGLKTFAAENTILESNQTRRVDAAFESGAMGRTAPGSRTSLGPTCRTTSR